MNLLRTSFFAERYSLRSKLHSALFSHLFEAFSCYRDLLNVPVTHEVSQVPDDDQHGVSEVRQDGNSKRSLLKQLEVLIVFERTIA